MKPNKSITVFRGIALIHNLIDGLLDCLKNEQFGIGKLVPEPANSFSQLHSKPNLLKGKSYTQFFRDVLPQHFVFFNNYSG